jgi:hypothetical protein
VEELAVTRYVPAPQSLLSSLELGEKNDPLRSDPGFTNILERMNFGARWS